MRRRSRRFARAFASTLALVLTMACAAAPRTTSEPGACTALTVRSSRGPRTYAGGAAAVPEGVWVLRDGRPATLTLFDHDRRVRTEIDAKTLFPHRKLLRPMQLVGNGHALAVLGQYEDGTSAVATVAPSGTITRVVDIDIQGDLVAGTAGRLVVYDWERMRLIAGDRIVGRYDEPSEGGLDGWSPRRVLAATASGYVEARATDVGDEMIRVTVRWFDAEGRPEGDAMELATFELDRGPFVVDPRIAAVGDGAAIVYRDFDGLQFARVGTPGQILGGPTALWPEVRLSLDALAADEDAIWLAGSVFSRWGAGHDDRHIARLRVIRLDHQGRVTARGQLRTATGSAFRPRIVAVAPGGLFGIHHREVLGRLDSRRETVFDRWLDAGCRSTRRSTN